MQEVAGSKPRVGGDRMAGSYINFYICNGGVVMPAFGGEAASMDERCVACVMLILAAGAPRVPGAQADSPGLCPPIAQGAASAGRSLPRPQGCACAKPRDPAGRRQHPLHHAAAAGCCRAVRLHLVLVLAFTTSF